MEIILVDPSLVHTFLAIFLIIIMVHTLENNYFLCALNYVIYGKSHGIHTRRKIGWEIFPNSSMNVSSVTEYFGKEM